ncbi:MAG: hypothetical protein COV34_01065 [Candidatus Zambryskibacteria bacterium CG10_big_fil_rev_8_21_14_0_10_42_12]|uniref:VTT domain-containing protein n=1 Tax=Candidatus Zambryskibacteria bacterium CG10_big_fil_rev_8_21_14_0_10_42_12 TaxID=1975115 RepID=A0A2H0QV88_9BACT|nr:MAG: hypothetical protein COV34_01065 [Candidatus Zambryskibacteria bacterium CG10_big_fil_rev_8_21_14_0_10_42_12]
MLESILHFLTETVLPLGPFGVFVASLIEEIIAPIPSALVMLGSGFLFVDGSVALQSILRLVTHVAIPVALGVAIGSLVVYSIARYAGTALLLKWGTIFGISESDVEKAHAYFKDSKRDDVAVFVARVIPVVPAVVIAVGAGLIEMPVVRYLVISVLGTFIRALILGAIGWQVGSVYTEYAMVIARWEKVIWVMIGAILIYGIVRLYQRKQKNQSYGNI